jgi:hypothetical protein
LLVEQEVVVIMVEEEELVVIELQLYRFQYLPHIL